MIARLGYRRLLPIANLLLFALLLSIGYMGDSYRNEMQQGMRLAEAAKAEGWQPTYIERPTPFTHLIAWSLNFPAMLFATPFGLLAKGWKSDAVVNGIAAIYLIVLWFVVGLWLDRRKDPSRVIRRSAPLQSIRWTALVVSSIGFLMIVALVISRIVLHQFTETICTIPMLFWPFFLAYASRWEIKHAQKPEQTSVAVA